MTTHVDFTSLVKDAASLGLAPLAQVPQAQFLVNLGLDPSLLASKDAPVDLNDYYARRRAMESLVDPAGLGRVQVLLLSKSAPAFTISPAFERDVFPDCSRCRTDGHRRAAKAARNQRQSAGRLLLSGGFDAHLLHAAHCI